MITDEVLKLVIDSASTSVVVTQAGPGSDRPIVFVNGAFERLSGYTAGEVEGRDCRFMNVGLDPQPALAELSTALENGEPHQCVVKNRRKDGSVFWNELSVSPVFNTDGNPTHFVGIQHDATEKMRDQLALQRRHDELASQHAALKQAVYEDELTQLPNRRAFDRALRDTWRSHESDLSGVCVLRVDIDNFSRYNSIVGLHEGDHCLWRIGQTLAAGLKDSCVMVARYVGDEFAILLTDTDLDQANAVAERARHAAEALGIEHLGMRSQRLTVTVVGACISRPQADDYSMQQLWRKVDAARYLSGHGLRAVGDIGNSSLVLDVATAPPATVQPDVSRTSLEQRPLDGLN